MSDLRKAAEMALQALMQTEDVMVEVELNVWQYKSIVAINALRQALAPEVTPEGWVKIDEVRQYFDSVGCGTIYKTAGEDRVPLYLAPPKKEWVGLTADEIWTCNKAQTGSAVEFHICSAHQNVMDFAEAIEAKLKEKNT